MPSLFISYRRGDSPDTVKLIHERLKQRLRGWDIFYDHQSIPQGEPFPELLRAKVTSATVVLVIIGPRWLEIRERHSGPDMDQVREEVRLALEAKNNVIPVAVGNATLPSEAELADFSELKPLLHRNGREVRPDPLFDVDIARLADGLEQLGPADVVGTILADKYKVTAQIGEGGMGIVYLAEQTQPVKRTVALKLIKPGMDSKQILARFDAERQALALMDHSNIARVLDAGATANGRPFFVMEYVKGVPITQYCDDKKLSTEDRLALFQPVCRAVQHAHQKGIIHRDIKPSNVLVEVVDDKPVPKVIDFGLAKALGGKLTDKTLHTAFETRVGTLEYSSPEQATGQSFDIDTRTDIYSLGVLLYELLTGKPPFSREELLKIGEAEMCRVIREQDPPKPSTQLSSSGDLPAIAARRNLEPAKLTRLLRGELDWIVMKCLEKERSRRYETANELGLEVQRFLADEPVHASPPSARYRMKKFLRRHKGPVFAAALVVLALVAGIIGTSIGLMQAEQARNDEAEQRKLAQDNEAKEKLATKKANEEREEADKQKGIVLAQAKDLKAALVMAEKADLLKYIASMNLVQQSWERSGQSLAVGVLAKQIPSAPQATDFREFEWDYWWRQSNSELLTLPGPRTVVGSLAFSPNGKHVAATGSSSGLPEALSVWDVATGKEAFRLKGHTDGVNKVAFSPDGRWIATGSYDNTVRIWDAKNGREIRSLPGANFSGLLFSPDGRRLITFENEDDNKFVRITLWDVSGGTKQKSSRVTCPYFRTCAVDPEGRYLALGGGSYYPPQPGPLFLWDLNKEEKVFDLRGHSQAINNLDFRPGGHEIVSTGQDRTVRIWDTRTGHVRFTLRGHTNEVRGVAYSPDGRVLASGQYGLIKFWDPNTGEELRTLRGTIDGFVAFSPLGNLVASGGGTSSVSSIIVPGGRVNAPAETRQDPDKGSIKMWDATGSQENFSLRTTYPVRQLAFSPDRPIVASVSSENSGFVGKYYPRGRVEFWDVRTGQAVTPAPGSVPDVSCLAFSPKGDLLAIGAMGNTILIWDVARGDFRQPWKEAHGILEALAFSPDGKWLVSVGGQAGQGVIVVWDAQKGEKVRRLTGHTSYVRSVSFHPDGQMFASACWDKTVIVWDTMSGKQVKLLEPYGPKDKGRGNRYVDSVAFSRDGSLLACGGDEGVVLWDTKTWQQRVLSETGSRVAFSPDSRRLAASSWDIVRFWDVPTGQQLLSLQWPSMRGIAFSPDGTMLTSLGADAIYLWDASKPKPITAPGELQIWEQRWRGWRQQQLSQAQKEGDWFAVTFHLDRLIANEPANASLYAARAASYAEREKRPEAAADLTRATDLQPDQSRFWSSRTMVALQVGDTALYGKLCAAMLERFGKAEDALVANNVAWTCVVSKDAMVDRERIVALAEKALASKPGTYAYLNTLGAALYRAGQFEDAVVRLNEAVKAHGKEGTALDWLFLSMAHAQLGHAAESRQWWNKAKSSIDEALSAKEGDTTSRVSWTERLELRLLRQEAEQLLK